MWEGALSRDLFPGGGSRRTEAIPALSRAQIPFNSGSISFISYRLCTNALTVFGRRHHTRQSTHERRGFKACWCHPQAPCRQDARFVAGTPQAGHVSSTRGLRTLQYIVTPIRGEFRFPQTPPGDHPCPAHVSLSVPHPQRPRIEFLGYSGRRGGGP